MVLILVLSSCVAFGAIALESEHRASASWVLRLWARLKQALLSRSSASKPAGPLLIAPVVTREPGWTFIRSDDVAGFEEWVSKDDIGFPTDEGEPALGSHLLIEMYGCPERLLCEVGNVGSALQRAADESEATTVATSFHEFEPYGVSGAVIIQESHYTIHTWPEHGYAAVDLFYCGGTVKVDRAIEVLRDRFQPSRMKFLVVRRGLRSEVGG